MLRESGGDEGAGGVFRGVGENFLNLGGGFLVVDSAMMQGLLGFVGRLLRQRSTRKHALQVLGGRFLRRRSTKEQEF